MAQTNRLGTERTVAQRMRQGPASLHPEFMAIAFSDELALLGLPGEFFVETVAELRERGGVRYLPVACYANHYIGYVVPPGAFDDGGYEPGVSLLAPEAEETAKRETLSLLQEVMR